MFLNMLGIWWFTFNSDKNQQKPSFVKLLGENRKKIKIK